MNQSPELSRILCEHIANMRFEDISHAAACRTEDLFLDWLGSGLAGAGASSVSALRQFADVMGPSMGESQTFDWMSNTSPYFAAMINAAASHVVEQDDLHNGSVLHPATVVFPPLLAVSQMHAVSGEQFITAAVAGYEAGIRIGEYLGRSHYKVFHTTATVGTMAAAMAVGKLLNFDTQMLQHTLGSAGTQAGGLWEFLRSAADSKQLHTAKAAADGMLAAYTAYFGLTGADRILEGKQGVNAGMLGDGNITRITEHLGTNGVLETSFKYHASCRHTHPSADALLKIVTEHSISAENIATIEARVYQAAEDVLGPVTDPQSIHQAKFSMGFVLALIASKRSAGVADFTKAALSDPELRSLHDKVTMVVDAEIDHVYPTQWSAKVILVTKDGQKFEKLVAEPKGDPGNMLTRPELETKFLMLAELHPGMDSGEAERLIRAAWNMQSFIDTGKEFRITAK